MRYKQIKSISPNKTYVNLNFAKIKRDISENGFTYEDFDIFLKIRYEGYMITVDHVGNVKVFFNSYDDSILDKFLNEIEKIFQKQINNFRLLH